MNFPAGMKAYWQGKPTEVRLSNMNAAKGMSHKLHTIERTFGDESKEKGWERLLEGKDCEKEKGVSWT
jgi:hypothetical protein